MKTRDKILAKSRELFNQKGIGKVSARDICEALGISLGNFSYYFPSKPQIVIELYQKMMEELEEVERQISIGKDQITYFLEYHRLIFQIQDNNRFFYLNTFELLEQHPGIKDAYLLHTENDKAKVRHLFQGYLENGVFQKDTNELTLERLINIGHMVYTFWVIDAELGFKEKSLEKFKYYVELCCSLITPYLTPSALEEFNAYFKKFPTS